MYLDFTYFAKQDSDWLSISSLISMFGYRGVAVVSFASFGVRNFMDFL